MYVLLGIVIFDSLICLAGVIEWVWERWEKRRCAAVGAEKHSQKVRTGVSAARCARSSTGCGSSAESRRSLRKAG